MARNHGVVSAIGFGLALVALTAALPGCSSSNIGESFAETDRVYLAAAGSWDRDRDGIVTCDEWKAYADEVFTGGDANKDGVIDATEFTGVTKQDKMFQTAGFSFYDSNGNGKLERAEFVERPNRAFAILDKDKTCRLSSDQVAGARAMTRWSTDGQKRESGDPREKKGIPDGL